MAAGGTCSQGGGNAALPLRRVPPLGAVSGSCLACTITHHTRTALETGHNRCNPPSLHTSVVMTRKCIEARARERWRSGHLPGMRIAVFPNSLDRSLIVGFPAHTTATASNTAVRSRQWISWRQAMRGQWALGRADTDVTTLTVYKDTSRHGHQS